MIASAAKTYGYIRFSTPKQGYSADTQETAILKYVETAAGLPEYAGAFVDPATSGKTPFLERKGAAQATATLKPGDHLVAVYVDRLGRNMLDAVTTCDLFVKRKVVLHVLDLPVKTFNPDDPLSVVMLAMISAFAQFERQRTVDRIKAGLAYRRDSGLPYARAPVGYRIRTIRNGDKVLSKVYEEDPLEFPLVEKIKELRAVGYSASMVFAAFKGAGVRRANGRPWSLRTISRVMKDGRGRLREPAAAEDCAHVRVLEDE